MSLTEQQARTLREIGVDVLAEDILAPLLDEYSRGYKARYESTRKTVPQAEADLLRSIGANIDFSPEETQKVFAQGKAWLRLKWRQMLDSSLTRSEVANVLGLSVSRVSQLMKNSALYSIMYERKNWFPKFQFVDGDHLVPQLSQILPHLRRGVHPVLVEELFTTPTVDLLIDGKPSTPIDWLDSGYAPDEVILLARAI